MNRILTAILIAIPSLALVACGSSVTGGSTGITKSEARIAHGVDPQGNDACAAEGWYQDGVCDDFCPLVDALDCAIQNHCPNPADPAVHRIGDASFCAAADWACPSGQIAFDSQECGCGCIDQVPPGPMCGGIAAIPCAAGQFCNFAIDAACGADDMSGTCQPIPDVCPEYYGPVCGCNGTTYDNPCFASGAGISVASDGPCPGSGTTCGGFGGAVCAASEFCAYPLDAMCGAADQTGTCTPKPEACDAVYAPVCGCNGTTYGNACEANGAGTAVASNGPCPGSGAMCGGLIGMQCGAGELCDFTIDQECGGGDQGGTCIPIPEGCTEEYQPVCGCDGVTYGNTCDAHQAGVVVAANGVCP